MSGNKNDIRQNIVQLFAEEKIPFIHRCESLISAEDKFLIKTDFHGLANYPLKEQLSTYFQSVVASNVIFWGGIMKSNQITYREDEEYMQKLIALAKKNRGGY